MKHLFLPIIFLLYVAAGIALADPTEYMAYDYETEAFVVVQPQGDDTAVIYNVDSGELSDPVVIIEQTPDSVTTVEPGEVEPTYYLKGD